jgi:hypothetical protein
VTPIKPEGYVYTVNGWTQVTSIEFARAGTHMMCDIIATSFASVCVIGER